MAIFSISDMVIATTLFINAVALISPVLVHRSAGKGLLDVTENSNVYGRFAHLLSGLRKYSFLLAVWNVIFFLLMLLVFD